MTTLYLPFDQDGLIELEIELSQNDDYDWILTAEVTQNLVFEDQDDPRRLCRFVDIYGRFSHVMSPADDVSVPALPAVNADNAGCMKKVRFIFRDSDHGLSAADKAQETYNAILYDLDEYIRAKMLLKDENLELVDEIYLS